METLGRGAAAGEIGRPNSDKINSGGIRLKRGLVRSLATFSSCVIPTWNQMHIPLLVSLFINVFLVVDNRN